MSWAQDLGAFFVAFYSLPRQLNQKFLSHDLNSAELLYFAFAFFWTGNATLRLLLCLHLAGPSGQRFLEVYSRTLSSQVGSGLPGKTQPAKVTYPWVSIVHEDSMFKERADCFFFLLHTIVLYLSAQYVLQNPASFWFPSMQWLFTCLR